MPDNAPEPQTVGKCAELQMRCRGEVFGKIETDGKETRQLQEDQHSMVMKELGTIKEKLAYNKGQENGKKETGSNAAVTGHSWGPWMLKALFTWGPFLLLVLFLGIRQWLEKMGWW